MGGRDFFLRQEQRSKNYRDNKRSAVRTLAPNRTAVLYGYRCTYIRAVSSNRKSNVFVFVTAVRYTIGTRYRITLVHNSLRRRNRPNRDVRERRRNASSIFFRTASAIKSPVSGTRESCVGKRVFLVRDRRNNFVSRIYVTP